jgi:hypothetical protein
MVDREFFIDAFNRRYHGTGMTITGVEPPPSTGATGDAPAASVQ